MQGEIEPMLGQNEMNIKKNSENLKIPVLLQITLGDHLWSVIILLVEGTRYQNS